MARWSESPKRRIDARAQNAEGTAHDVRGAHRDTGGRLIGGYMPQIDGSVKAFGTKAAGGRESGLDRWARMNPNAGRFGKKAEASASAPASGSTRMPSGSATPTRGLDRWAAMNPNAAKPFSPGSPSNPAKRPAVVSGPDRAEEFAAAAMPVAPVPTPVPTGATLPTASIPHPARKPKMPWSASPLAKR